MIMIRLKKQALGDAMEQAGKSYALAGPVKGRGGYEFRRLAQGQCPELTQASTRLSPKALLFPQAEPMFHFTLPNQKSGNMPKKSDKQASDEAQKPPVFLEAESFKEAPLAIVGIRPCDARALDLLKLNFDSPSYKDPFFIRRYEAMVRVGLADLTPGPADFSMAAGSGPFDTASVDILLADIGEAYIGQVVTEKGEAFAKVAGFEPAEPGDADTFASLKAAAEEKTDTTPVYDGILEAATLDLYEADFWQEASFSCFNCGTCTFACPTCWCFDIQDEVKQDKGVRLRLWDSCMTDLYSAHASGHNPRLEGYKRFRNRFMHKLKYFPEKYDAGIMCVGCGRCITQCPAGIDIRNVMAAMNGVPAREEVAP